MEKVTIHEVKELHLTINEPFCVIQRFSDGRFQLYKNVGNDSVMKISNICDLFLRISPLDSSTAQTINALPNASESDIEEVQKLIAIFNNNL